MDAEHTTIRGEHGIFLAEGIAYPAEMRCPDTASFENFVPPGSLF